MDISRVIPAVTSQEAEHTTNLNGNDELYSN